MDQLRSYSAGICVCHQRPKAPHDGLQTRLDQDGCFPSVPWVFRGKAKVSEKQANNRGWTSFIAKRYSKDILESVYIQSKLPYHILLQSHTTENDAQCENFKTSENLCWQMCPLSNKCIFFKKDFNTKLWILFKKNVQCSVKKKKSVNQNIPFLSIPPGVTQEKKRQAVDHGHLGGWRVTLLASYSVYYISMINHLFLWETQEPSHLVLVGHFPFARPYYVPMRQGYLQFQGTTGDCLSFPLGEMHKALLLVGSGCIHKIPQTVGLNSTYFHTVLEAVCPR